MASLIYAPGLGEEGADHLLGDDPGALRVVEVLLTGQLHSRREALGEQLKTVAQPAHVAANQII